jgi:hypothetical protein
MHQPASSKTLDGTWAKGLWCSCRSILWTGDAVKGKVRACGLFSHFDVASCFWLLNTGVLFCRNKRRWSARLHVCTLEQQTDWANSSDHFVVVEINYRWALWLSLKFLLCKFFICPYVMLFLCGRSQSSLSLCSLLTCVTIRFLCKQLPL